MTKKTTLNAFLPFTYTKDVNGLMKPSNSNTYLVNNHKTISWGIGLLILLFGLFTNGVYAQDVTNNIPGSYTTTVPTNAVSATVEIWGAGGAGGGSLNASRGGSGGGGGGYTILNFTVSSGQNIDYIVGKGGDGGYNSGEDGTLTELTHLPSSTTLIANGGKRGIQRNNVNTPGGAGGVATGGSNNITGQKGGDTDNRGWPGGNGGSSPNGGTEVLGRYNENGYDGNPPGGGAAGGEYADSGSNRSRTGGNGANGRVIITYTIAIPLTVNLTGTPDTICPGGSATLTATSSGGGGEQVLSGSNSYNYPITDGDTSISPINLSGSGGATVANTDIIQVTLNIDHTYDADLVVSLISPTGEEMFLFTDIGGGGNNFTNTIIRTDINNPIQNYGAPFTGIFSPENGTINDLVGSDIDGQWRLHIYDNGGGDEGELEDWSLDIIRPGGNYTTTITGPGTVGAITYSGPSNSIATATVTPPVAEGTYTYTATTTDSNSTTATDTFVITVEDDEAPVITCIANGTRDTDPDSCTYTIIGTEFDATFTDNCTNGTITNNFNNTATLAGGTFPLGATSVLWTVNDGNGQIVTCTTVITVEDNQAPVITCPTPASIYYTNANDCFATLSFTATVDENCGSTPIVTYSFGGTAIAFPYNFPVGTSTVLAETVDGNNQTDSCSFNVVVEDNVLPTVICQNITVQLDATGNASIVAADIDNGSNDPCGIASLSVSPNSFSCSNVGDNTVTLTVTDNNGNISTCTATVTIEDNVNPSAVCQNITVQLDATGNASITGADIDNGSSDNCGITSITASPNTFNCSNVGANTVTLTVTDNNGNTNTCTATVTVEDNVLPTVVCQDITVQLDATGNATITAADIDNGSSDPCGSASLNLDTTSFNCSDIGGNTVTLTITDNNGNTASCSATVTVEDNVAPTAICQNITVQLDASGNASITTADIDNGSNDACGVVSLALDVTTFDCTNVGANTVTLTVTDTNGNTSTCTSTVTVQDNILPTTICQNITVQLDASGNASITAAEIDNGSYDNCGIASLSLDITSFDCSNIGANTVTLTATNSNGNTNTCTAIVTVEDNIPPTVICPADIVLNNCSFQNVQYTLPVSDNCSGPITIFQSQGLPSGSDYPINIIPGASTSTPHRFEITDAAGNMTICTFNVIIINSTISTLNVPTNITISNDPGQCSAIVDYVVTSSGTCSGASLVLDTPGFPSGSTFPVGTTTVTYSLNHVAQENLTKSFTVTVIDNENPTITCASNQSVIANASSCNATVTVIAPTFSDNCSAVLTNNITGTANASGIFPVGTTTITWTATDPAGLTATCTQDITVIDNEAPVLTCPGNFTRNVDSGNCSAIVTYTVPFSDNCGATLAQTDGTGLNSGSAFPVGTTTLEYTATDASGNATVCTFNVVVIDNELPIAVCQNITVTLDASGNANITAEDINNGTTVLGNSSDNCGIQSISLNNTNFDCSNLGTNPVTLTVTDNAGNIATCTATVTVLDPAANATVHIINDVSNNDSDVAICVGENLTFTATPTDGGATPTFEWFIDGASQGITFSPSFTPFTPLTVGVYNIHVVMQSSLTACTLPKVSNSIEVTVNDSPSVTAPTQICMGSTGNLTPNTGGTWTSNNPGVATVNNAGVITPIAPGTATFTFSSGSTTCNNTTNIVTINAFPTIASYPTGNTICESETHTMSPSTGGTWTSNSPGVATITNGGIITGVSPGNATFTFTNSTTNCTVTSTSIEVLGIPDITSVTASPNTVCAGDSSVLTANVQGAGGNTETIVNYDFNTGNNYNQLNDISTTPNINSNFYSPSNNNNIPFNTGNGTTGGAFTNNTPAGNSLMQVDDWRDGNPNGQPDDGRWRLDVDGNDLNNYEDLSISFQYRRATYWGYDKEIVVYYRYDTNPGAGTNWSGWTTTTVNVPRYNNNYVNNWNTAIINLPATFNNTDGLQFMFLVDDGSDSYWRDEPHIYIDNLQIQGTTVGNSVNYAWTANTGINAGLPANAGTPSTTNNVITVNPMVTTEYTLTVTNNDGCPKTETVTVNVFPSPEITIAADYCPADIASTPQDESNMVQLVASANQPIISWEWNTGETGNTIYVDIAGVYNVIATTANGCSAGATVNISQELVINGDFSFARQTVNGPFADNMTSLGFDFDGGYGYYANPILYQNRLTVTDNVQPFYLGIFRSVTDHTGDTAAQYLAVNGNDLTLAVWRQEITVEPNTDYYFAAWGIDISDPGNPGLRPTDLTFRINGTDVGTPLDLVKGADWDRFWGVWNSGTNTTAIVEIRNIDGDLQGNNFAIDDVSFATLSTFINLTSPPATENQTVCQNTPLENITFNVGGGLTGPTATGLPVGLTTTFDGLEYIISGTPTDTGTFNYTISTNASCGNKTFSGTIVVNPAPIVTITTPPTAVCASDGTILLSAVLSGSATGGVWSISGTPITTTMAGNVASATYTIVSSGLLTFTFTSNNPSGVCERAIETLDIEISPYVVATTGVNQTTANCATNQVTLTGNNVAGQWSVTSGQPANSYFFSDVNAYNATFTGESGETYTLQWEATNTGACNINTTALMDVIIPDCGANLVFDGGDDYINFDNNYNLNNSFSIEAWIKINNLTGTKTIISKRNGTSTASGYDLSMIGDRLYFRYNGSQIVSNYSMNTSKWYHVAVSYNGSYTMYIDGFEARGATAGSAPAGNTNKALIGAMDITDNSPTNYFNGGIDEVRIWNTALSVTQIREMMNQEIKTSTITTGNVEGVVVPMDISGGLLWNNLRGYYQMNTGDQTSVSGGIIQDISTVSPIPGKLNSMITNQAETAPIPYVSRQNNVWDNASTWSVGSVQQIPNSAANSIVANGLQTWNIVRTATNVTTNRTTGAPISGRTTVLGLLVDSNTLSIEGGQPIYVNKYLKIDGTLDLVGESQLLQPMGSIVDYSGIGKLERDQKGTANTFSYNYWGSPVSTSGTAASRTYTLDAIFNNGSTQVIWTSGYNGSPTPLTISNRWIYSFEEGLENDYSDWIYKSQTGSFNVGLGFTMKGSGASTSNQNYTFKGMPNNGDISANVTATNGAINQTLVGNPYPSAIDADQFIRDNIPGGNTGTTGSVDGALYFWKQASSNYSHITADYLGGYATFNLSGGTAAVSPPGVGGIGDAASAIPKQYIPVGQGFFVTAADYVDQVDTEVTFKNSQRIFKTQASGDSVFLRTENDEDNEDLIKRIRLNFTTPEGAIRPLLLAFTPNNEATEGFDYGYDAKNSDDNPSDMSFIIEDKKYVIQGVGQFNVDNMYPVTLDLGISGTIQIELTDLENFNDSIDVFVYDALLGTYSRINTVNYQIALDAGSHANRYFITFKEDAILNIVDEEFSNVVVNFLNATSEIYINVPTSIDIKQVYLVNMLGQTVRSWNATNAPLAHECKLPVSKISEGTYIIKVRTSDNKLINKKIVIDQN
ncbi:HYR domain-containing protein [Bizionia arctica]|uniref:HYR domain-containing protein n=1 Tax=Bizionia arctica TaxID=1495645 RepID=A0A917GG79_9FLAO|nr:HYR domain-containing protein [Bizionia arctica]GGG43988.1 hypothetical protein GCM10010976_14480 [Bizionia arctica]